MNVLIAVAIAAFALPAAWLALEPVSALAKHLTPHPFGFKVAGALRLPDEVRFALMPRIAGADLATDEKEGLTEGERTEQKSLREEVAQERKQLLDRLHEIKGEKGEDKVEVEKREKALAEATDRLIELAKKEESTEAADFRKETDEKLARVEEQLKRLGRTPASSPRGVSEGVVKGERYEKGSENLFLDMAEAVKGRRHDLGEAIREYEEKFRNDDRQKSWAIGGLEEADLVLPDVQAALPYLRAKTAVVQLCREIRTSSPAIEFPVFKTGLQVGHQEPGEAKKESTPEFDLEVARVYTIAGVTDVPNQTLEDFPAARGWIATELGSATGAQEETDVLTGDGTGEPLGLLSNSEIPTRKVDAVAEASAGRNIITSIFRGATDVRVKGFTEPTDAVMNPAVWTDVVLSFEDNIGFLYAAPANAGAPADNPAPARIMGIPVTWSSYIPTNVKVEAVENTSPVVVGNFQDAIVLRRAPFRVDIDTSVGFKKNMTAFRGEERMGFIVVRPKSFVKVTKIVPSA